MIKRNVFLKIVTITLLISFVISLPIMAAQMDIKRGGEVIEASHFAVGSLDPHLATRRTEVYNFLIFETLLSYNPDNPDKVGPALATSYKVLEPTVLEFHLRKGVNFHDGSIFNAEVAKWNIERARDHPQSQVNETVENIKEIKIVDDYTIQLILNMPQPVLPLLFTQENDVTVFFASKRSFEQMGEKKFSKNPVGTGPMQFVSWQPDIKLELKPFSDYWEKGVDGKPLPYFNHYTWVYMPDSNVSALELRSGSVDIKFGVDPQDRRYYEEDPKLKVQELPNTYVGYPSFYINCNPDKTDSPFSHDVRLRQALQYAANRDALAEILGYGSGEPHYYWGWYPGTPGYDTDIPKYEYNLEKARQLVKEAGYPDGVDLEVKIINRPSDLRPLEVLQAMWKKAGINLKINAMDRLEWVSDGRNLNFEALSHSNTAQISPILRKETKSGSTYNWPGYFNPEVDVLWEKASVEYDANKRIEIYKKIQNHVSNDAFHFIGYRIPKVIALKKDLMDVTTPYNFKYIWWNK